MIQRDQEEKHKTEEGEKDPEYRINTHQNEVLEVKSLVKGIGIPIL